jgi:two-component system sensor histidine kinase/response regulator
MNLINGVPDSDMNICGANLLLVDDEPDFLMLMSHWLREGGYAVRTASNGREALEACVQKQPDLILLDVLMPEIGGLDVCRTLKSDPKTHNIPVIMVTALAAHEDRMKGLECGADDFISKPFDNAELMARTRSLLRSKFRYDALRDSYQTLTQIDAARKELTQMIVHDMRSPLTSAAGYIDLVLQQKLDIPEKPRKWLGAVHNSIQTLAKMVTDMFDISRMEDGVFPLEHMRVDINNLVSSAVEDARARAPVLCGKTIDISVSGSLPAVTADATVLARVLSNFLQNGIRRARAEVRVVLRERPAERDIHVCVTDDGPELHKELRPHMFSKFSGRVKRQFGIKTDSGLGLAFCKLAVEQHGGSVWFETSSDKGTSFHFTVPVQPKAPGEPKPAVTMF